MSHDQALIGLHVHQKANLRASQVQYVEEVARKVTAAKADAWEELQAFRTGTEGRRVQQWMRPILEVRDESGQAMYTVETASAARVSHFAKIEGGFLASPVKVVRMVMAEQVRRAHTTILGPLNQLLSLTRIEEAIRAAKSKSASGPDGIGIDLIKLVREWLMPHLFALYLKSSLARTTPVQYRGGELFQLYKGKGTQALLAHYRSILLADCVGKLSARAYRKSNISLIGDMLSDGWSWQCGGVPGLGSEFPVLAVRMLQ